MSPPNGSTNGSALVGETNPPAQSRSVHLLQTKFLSNARFSPQEIKDLCAALEVPFDGKVIYWRVTNTSKNGKPRGQVIPYADQRAYTDRLNALFTPAGWTRKYRVYASANFERSKDQKTVAKVFVTCELSILGLGAHSATGEEWSDDDNAVTSAEAQAFKRSCACFGLGRYLYHFEGDWVDLDNRKRPRNTPRLPAWATPDGWQKGLRPNAATAESASGSREITREKSNSTHSDAAVLQIEQMAKPLGARLYRGVLRDSARVWSPNQITDPALQRKVFEQMQSAERGLERLRVAVAKTGPVPLNQVLQSLKLRSLEVIDSLDMLKRVVFAIEAVRSSR
jgi:hypothetical protein